MLVALFQAERGCWWTFPTRWSYNPISKREIQQWPKSKPTRLILTAARSNKRAKRTFRLFAYDADRVLDG